MIEKLTLNVEALKVESFQPGESPATRGTVVGADAGMTLPPYCVTFTCGDSQIRPCLAD